MPYRINLGTASQTLVKPRMKTKGLPSPFLWLLFMIIFKLSLNVREWITKELHFLPKQFNLPSIVLYKELSHDVILEALFFL